MLSLLGTENPVKDSDKLIKGVSRIAKGTEFPALDGFGDGEGIAAQQVDVVKDERRKPSNICRLDGEAFGSKLLQGGGDVQRVPEHEDVDDEAQGSQLIFFGSSRDTCKNRT